MYYDVEWIEEGTSAFRRTFRAKDFSKLWIAMKYMNMERRENGRSMMKQIRIKVMNKYDGEFSDILGDYDADMELDTDRSRL